MDSSNIGVVNTALAVAAALAERDQKIEALQKDLDKLKARLDGSRKAKKAQRKSGASREKRSRKR